MVIELLYNLSVLVSISVLSGFIRKRFNEDSFKGSLLQGVLFGVAAIIGMIYNFQLAEGLIFDGRSIVISLGALFFGPVTGIVSAFMAVFYRIMIGGIGMTMGVSVILSSLGVGLIFYYLRKKGKIKALTASKLYIFGIIVHIIMLLLMLILPTKQMQLTFEYIALTVIVAYPIISVLIGKILLDQENSEKYLSEIEEKGENFKNTLFSIGDAVFTISKRGVVTSNNPVFERITGWRINTDSPMPLRDLLHQDDIGKSAVIFNEAIKEGKSVTLELRMKCRNEEYKVFELNASPLESEFENSIIVVARDISERKKVEAKLSESEEQYNLLAVSTQALLFNADLKGRLIYLNEAAAKAIGYTVEELMGRFYLQFVHADDRRLVHDVFVDQLKEGKQNNTISFKFVNKIGEIRWLAFVVNPLFKENSVFGLTGVAVDVTQKKKSEEIIEQSELKFRSVWESSQDGMRLTDEEGTTILVNNAYCKLVNMKREELEGKPFTLAYQAISNGHSLQEYKNRFLNRKVEIQFEREMVINDGTVKWIEVTNSYLEIDNSPTLLLSLFRNISQRKRSEIDLLIAKEKAEESSRIKSNFLATMSHELRTPMIGILGYTEILQEEIEVKEQREMVGIIRASGDRLMRTLNLILDLSKIETNKENLEIRPIDIIELGNEIVSSFEAFAINKGISITFESDHETLYVNLDERLFEQILNNLVNNALKFTKEGGVLVKATTFEENGSIYARIDVEDSGIGIAKEHLGVIFEEFRQVSEGYSRGYEGSGLGLSIVKRSVQLLDGEILVDSEPGKGSVFTLKFPIQMDLEENKKGVNGERKAFNKNGLKYEGKILIVENDEVSKEFILKTLENIAELHYSETGEEAIRMAKTYQYSLILMDIGLGYGMNGVQATNEIRKIDKYEHVTITAVTAYAMKGDMENFLANGFTNYLSKPFGRTELLEIVKAAFTSKMERSKN